MASVHLRCLRLCPSFHSMRLTACGINVGDVKAFVAVERTNQCVIIIIWGVVGLVETNFDDDITIATICDILSQSTPELTMEKLSYDF